MSALPPRDRPVIVTDRLELWIPSVDDIEPMIALVADPETHRYLGRMGSRADHFSRVLRNIGSWLLYGYGLMAVKSRADGSVIGNCGIFHTNRDLGDDFDDRAEAGWIIRADATGQGYASEAMAAALEWFDREFGREMVCLITIGNAPSMRLAQKLGFAETRKAEMPDGDVVQLYHRAPHS